MGEEANAIVSIAKDKPQIATLCGLKPDQTEVTFRNQRLQPADAVLLASDLSKPVVTGALTTVWTPAREPSTYLLLCARAHFTELPCVHRACS